ncbi:hypothetical protein ACOME3_001391 [Neoechinorhynchus agilis]
MQTDDGESLWYRTEGAGYQWDSSWKPFAFGSLRQMMKFLRHIPNFIRLIAYRRAKKQPSISTIFKHKSLVPIYGAPIGGIGSGTIGRGYMGEFCRYQLRPGIYDHGTCYGTTFLLTVRRHNQLLYQYLLTRRPTNKEKSSMSIGLSSSSVSYRAMYPLAYYTYKLPFLRLTCRQLSPFLPHNYKDSCLPVGMFEWTIDCLKDDMEVTLSLLWQAGSKRVQMTNVECSEFNTETICGIQTKGLYAGTPLTFVTSVHCGNEIEITKKCSFDPTSVSSSMKLWKELMETGQVTEGSTIFRHNISVLSAKVRPNANVSQTIKFGIGWHTPKVHFENFEYERFYTTYFDDRSEDAAVEIVKYAHRNHDVWNAAIVQWQNNVIQNAYGDLTHICQASIFNELYYIADGGTLWLKGTLHDHDFVKQWGKFAILEGTYMVHFKFKETGAFGQGMQLYNTLDVLYYASIAIIDLFPNLQLSIQYAFAEAILSEDKEIVAFLTSPPAQRKVRNTCPHDMGSPFEHPWTKLNSFPISNTTDWKDLNSKFVLMVYRDYVWTNNNNFLKDMWPSVKAVLECMKSQDLNGDGVVDNCGSDQTFDTWSMFGLSAYCAGLQMCAINAALYMAIILQDDDISKELSMWLCQGHSDERGTEILMNALSRKYNDNRTNKTLERCYYFNFDCRKSSVFMSAQLSGLFMLLQTNMDVEKIYPREQVESILYSLMNYNLDLKLGFINGTTATGDIERSSIQSEEVWVGTTFSILSMLIHYGMKDAAINVLERIFRTYYYELGLAFQTPESLSARKKYRHLGYLRPLAIWSIFTTLRSLNSLQATEDNSDHLIGESVSVEHQ